MDVQSPAVMETESQEAVIMWSAKRLALLSCAFLVALGAAVAQEWPVVQMVAGLGLLVSLTVFVFCAIINSLRIS